MCFARKKYDWVVLPSKNDHNLYVWLLPDSLECDQTVDQLLFVFHGHTADDFFTVRHDHNIETLISAGAERNLKTMDAIQLLRVDLVSYIG